MAVTLSESISVANKEIVRLVKENPLGGWDDAWRFGITPWDSGDVQPPLRDLILSDELDLPKAGRALVPGCGGVGFTKAHCSSIHTNKGYDATFIASHLELDTLRILSVTDHRTLIPVSHFDASTSGALNAKVSFEVADFFDLSVPDDQRFALIYDYTFFVAIPPVRRCDWGKQISALLKPGGYLITLVFPLNLPVDKDGPPFFVKPGHCADVLGDGWEKVLDKAPENSAPRHMGRERLVVYRRL